MNTSEDEKFEAPVGRHVAQCDRQRAPAEELNTLVIGMSKYEIRDPTKIGGMKIREGSDNNKKGCLSTRAKFMLLGLFIITLVSVIVILSILLAYKEKQMMEKTDELTERLESYKKNTSMSNLCLTPDCITTASRVTNYMDPLADPCENFYQYACGGWEEESTIPYHSPYTWSVLEDMNTDTALFFRTELEKPIDTNNFGPDIKARKLYSKCINPSEVTDLGLSEARLVIDSLGGLSFNVTETYPDFDLSDRLLDLAKMDVWPLFTMSPTFHRYKDRTFILQLGMAEAPILFAKKDSLALWQTYATEIIKVWDDLYAGETAPDAQTFLATYLVMSDLKDTIENDVVKTYSAPWNDTLLTIDEIQQLCPQINWTKVIGTAVGLDKPLPDKVLVANKAYIIALHLLINSWEPRALDNFLKFMIVMKNLQYFPYEYRSYEDDLLNRALLGKQTWYPEPRWHFCVADMKVQMPLVLARWYIDDYLQNEHAVAQDVDDMIEHVRSMYIEIFKNTDLLDNETREFAIRKVKAMDKQVAFPDYLRNISVIEESYANTSANDNDSYFMSVIRSKLNQPFYSFSLITELSEAEWQDLWLDQAYVANGYYSSNLNTFTILAGILQGAFYNLNNPKYMNYGSMGFTIGHEFAHGFDDTGRHFGIDGLVKSWWSAESEAKFNQAKQCYTIQYSQLPVKADMSNMTYLSNGNMTLDENLADNSAELIVFQAYEKWVEENGEEKLLPSPYLDTWQKQYYIAQAQGWCAKYTNSGLSVLLDTFAHSSKEARVNGMYQNSVRFADIFSCPTGSYMNPPDKCSLWK